MPTVNESVWLKVVHELIDLLSGGNPNDPHFAGLQIAPIGEEALWDDPLHGTYIIWEMIANAIPEWGGGYQPNLGHRFDDSYQSFIQTLAPPAPNPAFQQKMEEDRLKLAGTAKQRGQAFLQMRTDWASFNQGQKDLPPDQQLSYSDWIFESGYQDQLSGLDQEIQDQRLQFAHDAALAGGGWQDIGDALIAVTTRDNPALMKDLTDLAGATYKVHTWEVSPDLAQWLAEAKAGQGTSLTINIDNTTSTTVSTTFQVGGSAGLDLGFFAVNVQGGYTRSTIDSTSSSFHMDITIPAFGATVMSPGPWYNGSVVERYANGPFSQSGAPTNFWGPTGTCALRPLIVYIGYQPVINATLTESNFNDVQTAWNGGAGIHLGPFSFGGTVSRSRDTAEFNSDTHGVTLSSKSPHPLIIAVNSFVMPGAAAPVPVGGWTSQLVQPAGRWALWRLSSSVGPIV